MADAVRAAGAILPLLPLADLVARGSVLTKTCTPFKSFTSFWHALRQSDIAAPLPTSNLSPPDRWPVGNGLDWLKSRAAMNRGWNLGAAHVHASEAAAHDRLDAFLGRITAGYSARRDRPAESDATSGLSDALAVGKISARPIRHRGLAAQDHGRGRVEDFLRELAWREFSRDLFHIAPGMGRAYWRREWTHFPWLGERRGLAAGPHGKMFATGRMHNRVRMIAASFLVKHLLIDWRVGLDWFARACPIGRRPAMQ
ncbi:FAD-binding domain-containing protein [Paracoccus sp. SSK6]|uniref:FAD-binding domain-containing protein n=1 Tax=Paracoccus sp. SSK6 TaxID=3143131 RepID=UPI00321C0848